MDKKENIETAETEERRSSLVWNRQVVIFIVLPILTILVPLGGIPYLCGRLNFHMGLVVCMIYPVIWGLFIYCFVVGLIRLYRDWGKRAGKKKFTIVVEIGIMMVCIALLIIPFFIPVESDLQSKSSAYLYGFRDRIRSKADIEAIRVWMRTLNKENYDFTDAQNFRVPFDEWSKSLKVLNPPNIDLYADKKGNPQVIITWGGGFFH